MFVFMLRLLLLAAVINLSLLFFCVFLESLDCYIYAIFYTGSFFISYNTEV